MLFLGTMPLTLLNGLLGGEAVALWVAAAFLAIELTLMHVALSQLENH